MDVFFYEAFEEEAEALRRHLNPEIRAGYTWKTIQESGDDQPPAPVVSIRTQSILPDAWAPLLNAVLSRSTGYEHLLAYRERTHCNVDCGHLPRYCHRAVAEQTMLLWMTLLRKLTQQRENFARFHRDGLTGIEAEGKTLVVVGVGNIGTEVCAIGAGLGMHVIGVDIVQNKPDIHYQPLDRALPQADIIVATMNLTKHNRGYFDYDVLRRAKRGAVFVNVSRGEFSPPSVLLRLLQERHLGGVALDVYDQEAKLAHALRSGEPSDEPEVVAALALTAMENTILTPHNAFNTQEGVERKAAHSAQQLQHYLKARRFLWPIPSE